jgi:deferrochelatase/peroxidase EfeB
MTEPEGTGRAGPSRRRLLTGAGPLGAGAVAGGLAGYFSQSEGPAGEVLGDGDVRIPFYGTHQAGIITPAQDRLAFGSLNVVSGTARADLRALRRDWTTAAARMAAGQLVGEETVPEAPPVDTGEAVGSPVSRLTITIGYGPSLFDHRFGLAARKPSALADLPPLPNENLDAAYTGGDLCVQAGQPAIPAGAHIRLASPEHNGGTRILRRGYSFTDGIDPQAGTLLGGLFFIAFMKNPAQFIRLQQSLTGDALNEYIHHTGSGVFACPPGLRPGQHWGDTLFG